ncbi:hypothetical protein KSF78_0007260 [Schistosoma japonicum]|uniref:SJCHGC05469 protein n=1 Tax=Schistosoma japonicum TaxID=6182 RepID=Q5DB81_SCHJA|nr:SJCHGC05469 protein [Schistosoma japonicum]KAH8860633.1 hypothetical protein KSF78_0007260 [Schistosoma japonicum]KAH8860634.1 hypothetical protein KSF78_0007260 [Schistosoma japonicum]KAH8860635.1 hypothetical protein KSF78_0007260 [Schistosoma japonicum]KAH8860636.1 hypothetical protein KSF78_0007260 [Schistosoma japonicum]
MGSATSSQTRDVTFHPDDIVISDGVIDRIKEAAASIDNEKDETYASKSSKTEHSIVLRHELEEAERRYERRLQLLERRNEKLFNEAAEEYTRTVERLENKYMRPTSGGCCAAAEQRVEDCYKQNLGKVLLCSKFVSEYDRCVQNFLITMSKKMSNAA